MEDRWARAQEGSLTTIEMEADEANQFYPATTASLSAAGGVALEMWSEREAENGRPAPTDLSNACVYSSLLCAMLFGAEIRGNQAHFHARLADRTVLDLNRDARDVRAILDRGGDPYLHDRRLMKSRVVREQIDSCRPRVARWAAEYRRRHPISEFVSEGRDNTPDPMHDPSDASSITGRP